MLDELEFAVSSVRVGGTHVVRVFGELDLYTAPELREELDDLPSGVDGVQVDLTNVTFVDSAGLAVLVAAARPLRAAGGTMSLVVDDPRVLRVLEVTGLDRYFEIVAAPLA